MLVDAAIAVMLRPKQFRLSHREAVQLIDVGSESLRLRPASPSVFRSVCLLVYTSLRHRLPMVEDCVPTVVALAQSLVACAFHSAARAHEDDALDQVLFLPRVFEEMAKVRRAAVQAVSARCRGRHLRRLRRCVCVCAATGCVSHCCSSLQLARSPSPLP
jgi:hypothetical protein